MYAQVRLQLTGAVVPSKMELSVLSLKTSKGAFSMCEMYLMMMMRGEMRWDECPPVQWIIATALQHMLISLCNACIYAYGCRDLISIQMDASKSTTYLWGGRRAGSCLIVGPSWQIRALLFVVNSSCCGICLHCRKTKQAEKRGEAKADDADTSLWEEASAKHACLTSDPDTSTNYVGVCIV